MKIANKFIISLAAFVLLFSVTSCNTYQKLLKSNDFSLKYDKAKEFYNKGDYTKALPLFEELMSIYKGTKDVEKLYYFYAYCYYGMRDYLLAAHYFQNFIDYYPRSVYAEDAQYMIGYSYYQMSPPPSLEQTYTQQAIEYLQLFANTYPYSDKLEKCNNQIDQMRYKLETKAIKAAQLYFDIQRYRAAAVSYQNVLRDFPDTRRKEDIMFKTFKAYYLFADRSITSKQIERFQEAKQAYLRFVDEFPESKMVREAEKLYDNCLVNIENLTANE